MKKFEYRTNSTGASDDEMNMFGNEGWELVAVSDSTLYFKREKHEVAEWNRRYGPVVDAIRNNAAQAVVDSNVITLQLPRAVH